MGEEQTIDYVLRILDIPLWYYAIAVAIGVVMSMIWRWEGGLLSGYVFLIFAETVLIREPFVGRHFEPQLFWSWRVWRVQRTQILTNVVMFIPVGAIVGFLWEWRGLIFAAGLSIIVEVVQLITARGLCEYDDVVHNMIGAVIGLGS